MKAKPLFFLSIVLIYVSFSSSVQSQVNAYPDPSNAVISSTFSIDAEGTALSVFDYMDYHYTHFELLGNATIEVTASESITSYTISPQSLNIDATVIGNKLSFTISQVPSNYETPMYLVLQINSLEKLVILAERPQSDIPPSSGVGIYNVRSGSYNADSTGVSSAQSAIQQAIDDAFSFGGGIVYVPNGLYQVKENLTIKSNVHLYLEAGAVLKAISDRSQYISESTIPPLVIIEDAVNVKIYGRGEIDASGLAIMNPDLGFTEQSVAHPRRRVIFMDGSQDVILAGIIVKDGTGWTVELRNSNTVEVQNVKVLNHKNIDYKIQNDGINSVSSSNTLVNQCFVMTIDDAMCAKARYGDMNNCIFSNNVNFTYSAGVKAGMQSVGNMSNIFFRNCDIIHARRGIGIDTREGVKPITGVVFNDIRVEELSPTSGGGDYCIDCVTTYAPINNSIIRRVICPTNNEINLKGDYDITNIQFEGLELKGNIVTSEAQTQLTKGTGIVVTYSFDTHFTDNILYDSIYSNISSGWTNESAINNDILSDVSSNNLNEAWVEYTFNGEFDSYKARVYSENNTGTTWKLMYKNDTSTVWLDAFQGNASFEGNWSKKTFLANATKLRFYFYNAGGNINIGEIQCFADIYQTEDTNETECILIEPEDLSAHSLFPPFFVVSDTAACNGSYIETNESGAIDSTSVTGRVVADFYLDKTAKYYIYLRVIAASANDDSFWIIMDGDEVMFNSIQNSTNWIWVSVPQAYDLNKGMHRIEIVRRENNTKLDQIIISSSTKLPTACNDCPNVFEPPVVPIDIAPANTSNQLIIYPNPAGDFINIFPNDDSGELRIYNIKGNLINKASIDSETTLHVETFTNGFYVFQWLSEKKNQSHSQLILINKE